jgi:hypothetical protein
MILSADMQAQIIGFYQHLGYGAKRIVSTVKTEKLKLLTVKKVLKKFKRTGTTARRSGSGRRRSAQTPIKLTAVLRLAFSEDNRPGTHKTPRQIAQSVIVLVLMF